jgi:cation/acetate symporter
VASGLSAAGNAVPAALLTSLPGLVYVAGFDHLAYGLGLLAGVVLAGLLIAPQVAATGASTVTGALHHRFGPVASRPALVVVALMVLPLLAAEFTVFGTVAEAFLGIPYLAAVVGAFVVVAAAATVVGGAAFGWLSAAAYALFAASLLAPLALLAINESATLWPHAAHGQALDQIRILEEKLIEAGRIDFDIFTAHATPFASLDQRNVLALVASLALGVAVMPPLAAALSIPATRHKKRLASAWAALFVMVILLAVPVLAACAKLAIYAAMTAETPLTNLPAWLEAPLAAGLARIHGTSVAMLEAVARAVESGVPDTAAIFDHLPPALESQWLALAVEVQEAIAGAARSLAAGSQSGSAWELFQSTVLPAAARAAGNDSQVLTQVALVIEPLGLWLALPALSGAPAGLAPLMAAGPLAAALVMAAALTRSLLALGGSEAAPSGRAIVVALSLAALSAGLAAVLPHPAEMVAVVVASLSLGAAGLFPVLAIGLAWKRATTSAAAAAIVLGTGVTLSYDVGVQVFPAAFYRMWPGLSNAGDYAIEEFDAREQAWIAAEDSETKARAKQALDDWASGTPTRPGLANWFGIDSASGAVFGVPVGLAALVAMTLLAPRRRNRTQP